MGVLALWPLALLVLIPAMIILYILKQEAKPHEFSSTMLWKEVYRNIEATKPWEKLKKNILLILQLITIALFIFAMMGPWIRSLGKEQTQVILVIDNSASMAADYTEHESRLEAAKEAACDYIDSLPQNAVIHVIEGNQSAALIVSNSTDQAEAKKRIREIKQTVLPGTLSATLGLVESCANQSEQADIVFFTDTAFDLEGLDASVASFYSQNANMSVDQVGYLQKENQLLVLVSVTNGASEMMEQEINLYGVREDLSEQLLGIETVQAEAGSSASVYFSLNLSDVENMTALRAELNQADALEEDNAAWCVLEDIVENKVLLVTESNLFMEKALTNLSGVEVYRTSDVAAAENAADYDLYIFDGMVPQQLPATGSFLFINCEKSDYFSSEQTAAGQYITLLASDVTAYVQDTRIGVNTTRLYEIPSWGTGFMDAEGESAGFYGIYDGHKIAVIGFDLHQSDFCLQAQFPILVSNLADYLLNGNLAEQTSYVAGDSVVLHGSTRGSQLDITLPDQSQQVLEALEASGSYLSVDQLGLYQVSQTVEDELRTQMFSVGFPGTESVVESAELMTGEGKAAQAVEIHTGILEIRNYILILLLLLMVAEWIIYVKLR